MRAILQNPRYTGREVWNKQRRDEVLVDVEDVALGHESKMRWNPSSDWVWSEHETHPAIIDPDTFEAAQDIFAGAQRTAIRKERTRNTYVLSGMVRCAQCGRKMQGSWNHGQAYYRCKFPTEYAVAERQHGKTVYVREDAIVPSLDEWIASLFADEHLDSTCEALAAVSDLEPEDDEGRELDLRRQLKECDTKLARYRELLEQDADITVVATWIAEVERERKAPRARARPQADGPQAHDRRDQSARAPAQGHRRGPGRRRPGGQARHLRRVGREPHLPPGRASTRRRWRGTWGSCRRGCLSSGDSGRMSRDMVDTYGEVSGGARGVRGAGGAGRGAQRS